MPSAMRMSMRKANPPYLAVYPVKDVNWSTGEEFQRVPTTSELFKVEGNNAKSCADFDIRFYELVQSFQGQGAKPGS